MFIPFFPSSPYQYLTQTSPLPTITSFLFCDPRGLNSVPWEGMHKETTTAVRRMNNSPVATSPKTLTPSHSNCPLPIVPHKSLPSVVEWWLMTDPVMYRTRAGNHSYCESTYIMIMSCLWCGLKKNGPHRLMDWMLDHQGLDWRYEEVWPCWTCDGFVGGSYVSGGGLWGFKGPNPDKWLSPSCCLWIRM